MTSVNRKLNCGFCRMVLERIAWTMPQRAWAKGRKDRAAEGAVPRRIGQVKLVREGSAQHGQNHQAQDLLIRLTFAAKN